MICIREAAGLDLAEVVADNIFHVTVHKGGHLSTADALIRAEGVVAVSGDDPVLNAPSHGSCKVFCYLRGVGKLKRGALYLGRTCSAVEHCDELSAGNNIVRAVAAVGITRDDSGIRRSDYVFIVAAFGDIREGICRFDLYVCHIIQAAASVFKALISHQRAKSLLCGYSVGL